ncbi:hypothetical protein DRW03_21150 [Corallococcus sp. H22C18031201]|nr:hypothetical protein DRW03_21150 [Corallococcus sp. H22C18031201]
MMLSKLTHLSPRMREHIRMNGQGLYTFLLEKTDKYRGDNPFKVAGEVRVPDREIQVYERQMLPRLFDELPLHYRPPSATSLMTGVRKGEIRVMRKSWVHLDERYILIAAGGHRATTKGNKERRVPIPELLVPFLRAQLETKGPYLFPQPGKSIPYSKHWRVHDIVARACVRAGLIKGWVPYCYRRACGWEAEMAHEVGQATCPKCGRTARWRALAVDLRFKHLRSTWGTTAYSVTRDLRLVAEVLGHSDLETTRKHYARALPANVIEGADATAVALAPWGPGGGNRKETQGMEGNHSQAGVVGFTNTIQDLSTQGKAEEDSPMSMLRFPKPQATGSIPVGAVSQPPESTGDFAPVGSGAGNGAVFVGATWGSLDSPPSRCSVGHLGRRVP